MYRDGVSEGQFAQVIELEIPQIKGWNPDFPSCGNTLNLLQTPAALKKAEIDAKLTFVVVGKVPMPKGLLAIF
jgi:hypothetical protein